MSSVKGLTVYSWPVLYHLTSMPDRDSAVAMCCRFTHMISITMIPFFCFLPEIVDHKCPRMFAIVRFFVLDCFLANFWRSTVFVPPLASLQRASNLALEALYMLRQIRLSVTLRYCVKTRERRGMWSSPSGSPVSLAFWCQEWLMGDDPVQVKFECKEVDPL